MLDKDNIIYASASEGVKKISTDEKDHRKCYFMCFTLYSHSIQRAHQHIANGNCCLPTRMHPCS